MTAIKYCLIVFLAFYSADSKVAWLTPLEHDFGVVQHNERVSVAFEFKNISAEPIIIDNVRTECGCTAPDWVETPILPDSIGVINLEFSAKKKGYFEKRTKVYFSGQRKAEKLVILGEVVEE
ncbi:MAG: DUF1573 domain-containing protein [Bacteroidota bacterium]